MSLKSLIVTSLLTGSVLGTGVEQVEKKQGVSFGVERGSKVVESKSKFSKRDDGKNILEFAIDNRQSFYSVNVSVGTPAQNVTVLLDTGSSDLWILGDFNNVTACEAYVDMAYGSSGTSSSSSKKLVSNQNLKKNVIRDDAYITSSGFDWSFTTIFGGSSLSSTTTSRSPSATSTSNSVINRVLYGCDSMGVYTPGDSSTYKANTSVAPFMIQYADLTYAEGWWVKDTLAVNGVDVSLQFAVANVSNSTSVLGISFPELESSNTNGNTAFTYANLPVALKNQGLIDKISYSLYLNNLDQPSGVLLFGAVDSSKYTGQLYTVPLINIYSRYYKNPIAFDVSIHGTGFFAADGTKQTFTTTKLPGLLDSGTTYFYAPQSVADAFAHSVNAKWDSDLGYYVMKCPSSTAAMGSFAFDLGGFIIYTPLDNYVLTTSSKTTCALGIQPHTLKYLILGDVFLTSAYVVYDMESYEISIAHANFAGAYEQNIEAIVSTVPGAIKAPLYSSTWSTAASSIVLGGSMFPSNAVNPWTTTTDNGKTVTGSSANNRSSTTYKSSTKTAGSNSTSLRATSTNAASSTTKSKNNGVSLSPFVSGNFFAGLFVLFGSLL